MFNLDGMIPKLCLLAQELGEEGRERQMRSASLQALSAMVICTKFIWMYSTYFIFMHLLHMLAFQCVSKPKDLVNRLISTPPLLMI